MSRKRASVAVLALAGLAACVRYEDKPVVAPDNLAAIAARTLAAPALGELLRAHGRSGPWPPETWDLGTLTLAGFYYHPDLDVARAGWAVARAGTITAGARPNPDASVTPGYNSTTDPALVTPWILTLATDFTLETAGKRRHRVAAAGHLSEAARLHVAAVAWQVRSGIRRSLLELYAAIRNEALRSRQQEIQESIVALVGRQLEAGAVSPIELTRARVELGAVRLALDDARRERAEAHARLATSVGVSEQALDGIRLDFAAFEAALPQLPPADARRQALVNRPDILGALAEYAASQEALKIEVARQYPDLHLGPGYEMDQSDNKWTLGLGLALPIFHRNKGPIAEAAGRRTEAAATFTAVQATALGEIDLALAAYGAALEKVATTKSMVEDQQREVRSTRALYEAGEISRLELDGVELEVVVAELAAFDARVQALEAVGQLEDAMQSPAAIADWVIGAAARQPGAIQR